MRNRTTGLLPGKQCWGLYLGHVPEPDFITSASLATLFQAADLVELVGVMNFTEPGISGWLLLHSSGGQRQAVMIDHRGQHPIDPLAASQISKVPIPGKSEPAKSDEPWAKALLGFLGYQFKVEDTGLLVPIWSAGTLLAITGISGVGSTAKSLAQGMVLAVCRLHEIDGLRRDIEGYRFLQEKVGKDIVIALNTGKILCQTVGGEAVLKDLQARGKHPVSTDFLPAALRGAIMAREKHILLEGTRANIAHPHQPACTTAEPLVAITFHRKTAGPKTPKGLAALTVAQRRVYELLIQGDRNKEIADKMTISPHTVRHHVSAVLSKTGYPDRVLLIVGAGADAKKHEPRAAAQKSEQFTPKVVNPQVPSLPVVDSLLKDGAFQTTVGQTTRSTRSPVVPQLENDAKIDQALLIFFEAR
jgi:DNA-binding CsgD family transcriptional regulator